MRLAKFIQFAKLCKKGTNGKRTASTVSRVFFSGFEIGSRFGPNQAFDPLRSSEDIVFTQRVRLLVMWNYSTKVVKFAW